MIEPGRFLVAQAGALIAEVLQVKRNGEKTFVITDAGMNDLIRPALYEAHHEIWPLRQRVGEAQTVDVVGPICETGDFFARDRKLPPLKPGDLRCARCRSLRYGAKLELQHAAAPAEVLVEGANSRLIRRRETMADLLAPEIF